MTTDTDTTAAAQAASVKLVPMARVHLALTGYANSARRDAEASRAALAHSANTAQAQQLIDLAREAAREEAAHRVYVGAVEVTTHALNLEYSSFDELERWVTDSLLQGADDTWSGRGNDDRRAIHDAQRDAYREVLRLVRRNQS